MVFDVITNNIMLQLLLGCLVLDIVTGFLKAIKFKVLNSSISFNGIIKHVSTFVFYYVLYFVGYNFDFEGIVHLMSSLMLLNYVVSLIENFGVLGVYIPDFLKHKVENEIKKYERMLSDAKDD